MTIPTTTNVPAIDNMTARIIRSYLSTQVGKEDAEDQARAAITTVVVAGWPGLTPAGSGAPKPSRTASPSLSSRAAVIVKYV